MARLRPRVEEVAAGLLDEVERVLERDGRVDVIATYAEPLPVLVICELLGAPTADWKRLRDWSQAIVRMYEVDPDEHAQQDAQRACEEFAAYVERLAADRAAAPGDDLLTSLVQERDGGDRLSPRELVATVVLLLNAGHEASVNGFGNGLASLLADPAQLDAVLAALDEPAAVDRLVEEMLRHDSPLHLFERTATADVELHGVTVRRGEKVAALLGAANRDPTVFAEPDRFVADRDPNPHLAFGAGIHFCLGAPLARMELQISTPGTARTTGPGRGRRRRSQTDVRAARLRAPRRRPERSTGAEHTDQEDAMSELTPYICVADSRAAIEWYVEHLGAEVDRRADRHGRRPRRSLRAGRRRRPLDDVRRVRDRRGRAARPGRAATP